MIHPIKDTKHKITNPYSSNHLGIDYGYPEGTPVYAADDGKVVISNDGEKRRWIANSPSDPFRPNFPQGSTRELNTEDYGNLIKIEHKDNIKTLYAHLKVFTLLVGNGNQITKGQKIAEVGSTGNSTGNHLHFEVRRFETPVDPNSYFEQGGDLNMDNDLQECLKLHKQLVDEINNLKKSISATLDLPEDSPVETMLKSIAGVKGEAKQARDKALVLEQEVANREEQVSRLNELLTERRVRITQLQTRITELEGLYDGEAKAKGKALNDLAECRVGQSKSFIKWLLSLFKK